MEPLTVRFPAPADAAALVVAVRESLGELYPWMPWTHSGYSLDDALQWISAQAQARESGTGFELVIVGAAGRLLGCCGINGIHRGHRFANLGYWVRTSETRRGVATRAVKLVADWVFANTDLERLEILAAAGNAASQAVAGKAGALREGVLRSRLLVHDRFHDAVLFSLIRPHGRAGASGKEPGSGESAPGKGAGAAGR